MTLPTFTLPRRTPLKFSDKGVQGKIYGPDDRPIGIFTLERPWHNNKIGESCIPAGTYRVTKRDPERYHWARFPMAFELHGTEPRTHILIHPGNYIEHSNGCILVGLAASNLISKFAVWRSRAAIKRMYKIMPNEFLLKITNA